MIVWTEDRFVDPGAPVFAATDRGAILGDGVFETIKTVGGRAVFLGAHLDRMGRAAAALRLAWDEGAARAGADAVLAEARGTGSLRLTLTRGPGGRGLAPIPLSEQRPRLVVSWSAFVVPDDPSIRRGLSLTQKNTIIGAPIDAHVARLMLSSVQRNGAAPSCRHKTLSYADAAAARAEAEAVGADDAAMLSVMGDAACTSIANLWARTPAGFVTPPLNRGVLDGIVRARLLAAGSVGSVPISERSLSKAYLLSCPLYRSNSLLGVQRCSIEGGSLPSADNPLGVLYERIEAEALGP